MTSSFNAEPEVETVVLLTYPRGKEFKCYNNRMGWFGHVRDHKPHLFFRWGRWYVVNAGCHHDDGLKAIINKRNAVAYSWAFLQNATPKEREGLHYKIRSQLLVTKQKECP